MKDFLLQDCQIQLMFEFTEIFTVLDIRDDIDNV